MNTTTTTNPQFVNIDGKIYNLAYLVSIEPVKASEGFDGVKRTYVANFNPEMFEERKFGSVWLTKEQGQQLVDALEDVTVKLTTESVPTTQVVPKVRGLASQPRRRSIPKVLPPLLDDEDDAGLAGIDDDSPF